MTICSRSATIAATLLAMLAGAAQAAEAPDGPMATAGASGAPPVASAEAQATAVVRDEAPVAVAGRPRSTAEQIDDFIRTSPAAAPSRDEMAAMDETFVEEDRRVHGSVEVGVGTHGYRHGSVEAHYPLGKTGQVSVAVGTTRGRGVLAPCYGRYAGPLDGPVLPPLAGPGCYAGW